MARSATPVGQVYIERHYPPEASRQMDELIENLIVGFRGRLERLEWMDDETREEALTKLSTFEPRNRLSGNLERV